MSMPLSFAVDCAGRSLPDGMTFRDSQEAFQEAIDRGRLSADSTSPVYAGHYMYMHTQDGVDQFKHRDTRRYLGA